MSSGPPEAQVAIGTRLRRWRVHRGMFQETLADAAGVGQSAISYYELGQRTMSIKTLRRLAAALDINFQTLLDTDPPDSEGGSP